MVYLTMIAGLALLVAGGEGFVRGSVAIAKRLGISPLLIGLTLAGFGTSLPELATSIQAALDGAPGIAMGNVVGSNIANILLILGLTALICPVVVDKAIVRRDGLVLMVSALAALGISLIGTLGRLAGVVLVAMLVAYVVYCYVTDDETEASPGENDSAGDKQPMPLSILLVVAGLGLTVFGARLLVASAVEIATALGISETTIGLTIVAVGTSLPELVTSVIAALRRQTDLALGNILGSNIFNALFILGATALVQPFQVPSEIVRFDIWIMLGATGLLLVFAHTSQEIRRWEGIVFVLAYLAYVGWLVLGV